jgi:hypothetical protein
MGTLPASRRLKVMAFDPSLATVLETATVNEITLHVKWEPDLQPGPIGEYIEVVDFDPASGVFYEPLDLNDPLLIARDGLTPTESNPQFHQQMVYAVAMTTIRQFERALGRVAFWADRKTTESGKYVDQFVRRLRIYPHALRDRNAFYSPAKKALLFGYFPVTRKDKHNTPGTVVFTCLSHDIVAHEVTHALLDGVHPRFNESTNPDVHAFHEAFADIVALFQHFSYPTVLESQIRRTRGDLETENLLSQLAQQFGRATGRGGALRDALGEVDAKGRWKSRSPDARALESTFEPHDRGAILVAAVFRAFLLIYRARTADLFRIATQGTGVLPEGDIHPDLSKRLAAEAAKCAGRVLQMCIRAIDYCPPVDITFGDYLRGIITADLDVAPDDESGYRIVFIQSFREWGIHPRGVTSMGMDALTWPSGESLHARLVAEKTMKVASAKEQNVRRELIRKYTKQSIEGWNLESDRFHVWKDLEEVRIQLWNWLRKGDKHAKAYATLFGLVIEDSQAPPTVYRDAQNRPSVEVHSVRPAIRRTLAGEIRTDLVVEITQRRRGYFDPAEQKKMDQRGTRIARNVNGDFKFRTGCTILVDPVKQEIRRVIRTAGTVADNIELERVRRFLTGEIDTGGNAFDAGLAFSMRDHSRVPRVEPFALLHQDSET